MRLIVSREANLPNSSLSRAGGGGGTARTPRCSIEVVIDVIIYLSTYLPEAVAYRGFTRRGISHHL